MVGCEKAGDRRQIRTYHDLHHNLFMGWSGVRTLYSRETSSWIRPGHAAQSGDNIPISYGNSESAQRDATFADPCDPRVPDESPLASVSDMTPNKAPHAQCCKGVALSITLSRWRRTVTFGRRKSRRGLACGIGADQQKLAAQHHPEPRGPKVCRGRQVGGCGGKGGSPSRRLDPNR